MSNYTRKETVYNAKIKIKKHLEKNEYVLIFEIRKIVDLSQYKMLEFNLLLDYGEEDYWGENVLYRN
jgi:hypothetical protein